MSGLNMAGAGAPIEKSESGKAKQALVATALMASVALVVWGVSQIKLGHGPSKPKQQTVKIMLPDAPPPPPPKPEEKRPEPKPDNKPQPPQEQKQVQAPPAEAPLKMEGAAGNGESAFSAGTVSKDYVKGEANTGPAGGVAAIRPEDRRKSQFYINNIKRLLKEELERHLDTDERQLEVTFSLWIGRDGRVERYELHPTGNARVDADAHHAFDEAFKTTRLDKPGDVIQPLRMKLTLLPSSS